MDNASATSREISNLAPIREATLIENKQSLQILCAVLAVLFFVLSPTMVRAASYVYVPNIGVPAGEIGGISVIGTDSHTKVAELPGTSIVAFTPDGAFAFVVDSTQGGGGMFIVDTRTNEIVGPSPFNFTPFFSHDGATTYFTNDNRTIGVMNTATGTIVTTIQVPNFYLIPIQVTPNGQFLWAAGRATATSDTSQIFVIATATNTVVDTISIPSGKALTTFAFSSDGTRAYVGMNNLPLQESVPTEQLIQVIDVSTSDVVNTITVSDALGKGIFGVQVSRAGDVLYVTLGDGLHFIDVSTQTEVGFIPINPSLYGQAGPEFFVTMHGSSITPDGSQMYLSASLDRQPNFDHTASTLFIIDLARRTIIDSVNFGDQVFAPGAWGAPQITPDRACGEDFTTEALVSKSGFSQFIFPQLQVQYVSILNARGLFTRTTASIRGPITLFLTNIKNGIFVGNNAKSSCYASTGSPYTVVSAGPDNIFSPGEVVVVPLLFFKTGAGPITYTPRVVSGSPGQ